MKGIRWLSIGLAVSAFLAGGMSAYADDSEISLSPAVSSGYGSDSVDADSREDSTDEREVYLKELTDKIEALEEKRAAERQKLEDLKNELAGLKEQEEAMRAGLNHSIRSDYEASPDAGSLENLFVTDSSYYALTAKSTEESVTGTEEPVTVEAYLAVYEQYTAKTEEVQNKRVAIRQLDSQIASLEAPADRIGEELQQQRLLEKQEEAGTLQAVTVRQYLGEFTTTGYCPCTICCGEYGTGATAGYTASGTKATAGRTVAMGGVPFGTKLEIDGQVYTVEDRGTPYGHVDVYYNTHKEAQAHGRKTAKVYLITE